MPDRSYTFGEKLRLYRRGAGISQQELADKLKCSRQTVINWEKGDFKPSRDTIKTIAEELALDEEATDKLLIAADYLPYFSKISGTAPDEMLNKYCSSLQGAGLVREFGAPIPWSQGWIERVLIRENDPYGLLVPYLLDQDQAMSITLVVTEPGIGGTTLLRYLAHISADYDLTPAYVDVGIALATDPEPTASVDLPRWAAWSWDDAECYNRAELGALAWALRESDTNRQILWLLDDLHQLPSDKLSELFLQLVRLRGRIVCVTWELPAELRCQVNVAKLWELETSTEQKQFVVGRLELASATDKAQHILELFAKDKRLWRFASSPLALEAACALYLRGCLSGSQVIDAVTRGLLRRGGALTEDERRRVYLYIGGAAMDQLQLSRRGLVMDAHQANLAFSRICTRRKMALPDPERLLGVAARAGIVRRQSEATFAFLAPEFRDCMAAVVEDGETWNVSYGMANCSHLLYVAGLSSDKGHLTHLLEAKWRSHADLLRMGGLLVADYAIEMKRGSETFLELAPLVAKITANLEVLFRADSGLDMKCAVLRRLGELDPGSGAQLLEAEMMPEISQWHRAAIVELALALNTNEAWDLLERHGFSLRTGVSGLGGFHREARANLEPSYDDLTRFDDYVSALLALKSSDEGERLGAVRFLANAELPARLALTRSVRQTLGSRSFWQAANLKGGGLLEGNVVRYSRWPIKVLIIKLLDEALQCEQNRETRYFVTKALARLDLLTTLLRIDPLILPPLWSLALRYGFWVTSLDQVVRIDGEALNVNNEIVQHLRPVRDWSAHAWGLEILEGGR